MARAGDSEAERDTLLVVEDRFALAGRGLVLSPGLPLVDGFQSADTVVQVIRPDGHQLDVAAHVRVQRVRCVGGQHIWSLVMILLDVEADDIPIGSEVRCGASLCRQLGRGAVS